MKKTILIFYILVLVAVNLFVIYPYFFQDYPRWISSIEVGFITMGRWFAEEFLRSWWIPQWYAGIPFHLVYTPLIPGLTALVGLLIDSFGQAYHIVAGTAYILVPVSLFFFLKKLTKSSLAAFAGSFFFSIAPTFGLLFPELHKALIDELSLWRLIILVYYGEAPHTLAQAFFLPAALFAIKALEEKRFRWIFLSSLFFALTALSNPIGLIGGLILLGVIFFSWGLWKGDWGSAAASGIKIIGLGYLFSTFWYNPSFIVNNLVGEGSQIGSELFLYFPWRFLLFVFGAITMIYLLRLFVSRIEWGIALLWFLVMLILLGSFYYFGITLVPQVRRFVVELDLAAAAVLALLIRDISFRLHAKLLREIPRRSLELVLSLAVVLTAIGFFLSYVRVIDWFMKYGAPKKPISIEELREYKLTQWLKENTVDTDRVFLSANYTFWLNYFTDIWQLRGSHFQASVHPWEPHAGYQITAGKDGEISVLWAKIFNLRYLVVNPLNSFIHYQDYRYPEKFTGLLSEAGRVKEDIIYEVADLPGLARSVEMDSALSLSVPKNGIDQAAIEIYLDWLENGEKLEFEKISNDRYKIEGDLKTGEGIRVGLSYARGWRARDTRGNVIRIRKDPLGFILLEVPQAGRGLFTLSYFPPIEVWIGVMATIVTISSLIFIKFTFRK